MIQQLALRGQGVPARRLCAVLFLEELPGLMRERGACEAFAACLLLLEMTALLPRLVRAVFGVDLHVAKLGGAGSRHWTLQFSNGISLLVPVATGLGMAGSEAADEAEAWARRVLLVAEAAPTGEPGAGTGAGVRRVRERVLSIV